MTPTQIGILVLVFIGLALVLAVVINRIARRWKFRKLVAAMERPANKARILPPHKSAARPSNVKPIARKPVHKSAPKSAA